MTRTLRTPRAQRGMRGEDPRVPRPRLGERRPVAAQGQVIAARALRAQSGWMVHSREGPPYGDQTVRLSFAPAVFQLSGFDASSPVCIRLPFQLVYNVLCELIVCRNARCNLHLSV